MYSVYIYSADIVSLEKQREEETKIYYKKLAHIIMKAEKSHNLPSANWKPRNANGVIQLESEVLRTRNSDGPRQERENVPFLCLSVLRPSVDWIRRCHPHSWGQIFTQFTEPSANFFQRHPAIWASLSPVRLTYKINHHNYTHSKVYTLSLPACSGQFDCEKSASPCLA